MIIYNQSPRFIIIYNFNINYLIINVKLTKNVIKPTLILIRKYQIVTNQKEIYILTHII